jgi:37-kD nucleoid-associated bacterial protein
MNTDSFQVGSVMVHDIPRPDEGSEPVLTDAPVELDAALRSYFRRKVTQSLKERGVEVVADPTGNPIVREAVQQIHKAGTLAAESRKIAQHLFAVQTKRNSPGLVAVILGTANSGPCVSLIKLEREEGVRVRLNLVNGRRVIDLEFLHDLTLTDKTKVFKTSILVLDDPDDPTSLHGTVSDDQRGRTEGSGVANFFLYTFLGCKLRENPEKATRDFFDAAVQFINDDIEDPSKKGRYHVALLAAMQASAMDLRPQAFASSHLDAHDRPAFLQRVAARGLDPRGTFQKDTSLLRHKVEGFRLVFQSGMTLVGRREDLDDRVHLPSESTDASEVRITDAIKSLKGR